MQGLSFLTPPGTARSTKGQATNCSRSLYGDCAYVQWTLVLRSRRSGSAWAAGPRFLLVRQPAAPNASGTTSVFRRADSARAVRSGPS